MVQALIQASWFKLLMRRRATLASCEDFADAGGYEKIATRIKRPPHSAVPTRRGKGDNAKKSTLTVDPVCEEKERIKHHLAEAE